MTKIKDSFAIFKNIVLESRANGADGPVRETVPKDLNEETAQLQQQIKDLKSCLLQRDNEIAILVNMVKKERANAGQIFEQSSNSRITNEMSSKESESEGSFPHIKQPSRKNEGKSKSSSSAMISTAEREALRSEKIIKKHLFGVPPPEDRSIFEDMAGSVTIFECFKKLSVL